jgi:hypothetical protein
MMRVFRYLLLGLGVLALLAASVALVLRDFPDAAERRAQQDAAPVNAESEPSAGNTADNATDKIGPQPAPSIPLAAEAPAILFSPNTTNPAATSATDEGKSLPRLNLTAAQQEKVRDLLLTHSIMQTAAADFPLRQGGTVPESVPLLPVPHELADAIPNFQRYSYVIAQNRIVIVLTDRREIGFLISI